MKYSGCLSQLILQNDTKLHEFGEFTKRF